MIVNDPIHGHIELDPLCVKIIDTPQFQRLRHLKQLGSCYYVYPGASHNRFEHSIGVYHLAGQFVNILKINQPELGIKDKDVRCVKIAGLCHDLEPRPYFLSYGGLNVMVLLTYFYARITELMKEDFLEGHGPFSHLFETVMKTLGKDLKHEKISLDLFDHLIKSNDGVKKEFKKMLLDDKDIQFIKQLISGKPDSNVETGREEKTFLYQIVANDKSGIDVDKWDYFARDCHMLGIKNSFDHQRCMQMARVCSISEDNGEKRICYRDKEQFNLYEMFHTRYTLHYRAYKHKTVTIIDAMIIDAFKEASTHYKKIPGKDGDMKLLTGAIDDMYAFTNLTDDILYDIGRSTDDSLKKSVEIINRITKRDFYKLVDTKFIADVPDEEEKIEEAMIELDEGLSRDDFTITVVKFNYGKKEEDPMDSVYFYKKNDKDKGVKIEQKSKILIPSAFQESEIRLIYKKHDIEGIQKVKEAFDEWCQNNL